MFGMAERLIAAWNERQMLFSPTIGAACFSAYLCRLALAAKTRVHPVLLPRQRSKLARGTNDKEHAISHLGQ
jgi:hypothetical protein